MLGQRIRSLTPNVAALVGVQGLNFILPLLVYPYLVRVLHFELLGIVFLAQVFSGYFIQLVDFGFSNTAVRRMAQLNQPSEERSILISSILLTRLFLMAMGSIPYVIVILVTPIFSKYQEVFLLSYTLVVGQALYPYWFFQGVQKMKFQFLTSLFGKAIALALILIAITTPAEAYRVNLFWGLGSIGGGIIGWIIMIQKFDVRLRRISILQIVNELKDGMPVFISSFLLFLGSSTGVLFTGLMIGPYASGVYGLAEKIMQALRAGAIILYQVLLPRVSYLSTISHLAVRQYIFAFFKLLIPFFGIASLGMAFFADEIIFIASGSYNQEASASLRILAFIPLISMLSIPFSQFLIVYGLYRNYLVATLIGTLLGVVLAFALVHFFNIQGAAIGQLLLEIAILAFLSASIEFTHSHYSLLRKHAGN